MSKRKLQPDSVPPALPGDLLRLLAQYVMRATEARDATKQDCAAAVNFLIALGDRALYQSLQPQLLSFPLLHWCLKCEQTLASVRLRLTVDRDPACFCAGNWQWLDFQEPQLALCRHCTAEWPRCAACFVVHCPCARDRALDCAACGKHFCHQCSLAWDRVHYNWYEHDTHEEVRAPHCHNCCAGFYANDDGEEDECTEPDPADYEPDPADYAPDYYPYG